MSFASVSCTQTLKAPPSLTETAASAKESTVTAAATQAIAAASSAPSASQLFAFYKPLQVVSALNAPGSCVYNAMGLMRYPLADSEKELRLARLTATTCKHENLCTPLTRESSLSKAMKVLRKTLPELVDIQIRDLLEGLDIRLSPEIFEKISEALVLSHKNQVLASRSGFFDLYCVWIQAELGFKPSSWQSNQTFKALASELQKKGPLLVAGRNGLPFYKETPKEGGYNVQGYKVHGWPAGASRKEPEGFSHAVVIVGAEQRNDQEVIYYIDPLEPRLLLRRSYEAFRKECTKFPGINLRDGTQWAPQAFYNTNWFKSQTTTAETAPSDPEAATSST